MRNTDGSRSGGRARRRPPAASRVGNLGLSFRMNSMLCHSWYPELTMDSAFYRSAGVIVYEHQRIHLWFSDIRSPH